MDKTYNNRGDEVESIRFNQLSIWIKIAIIGGWISIISFSIGFLMGFLGLA